LVDLGQPLKQALEQWKHHDGEDVRDFAFKKELEHLLESQARVLYALCLLGESSFAELENVTQSTERRLQEDLAELRSYHLVSHAMESAAGARLRIPEAIRMMGKIISGRFKDPRVVEKRVEASRKGAPDTSARQAIWIHRVLALWKQTRHEDALNEAKQAVKKYPNGADLHCLLGRAYLLITPPDARNADRAFSEATRLGCQRSELYGLQIEAKRLLNDWRGMINLTQTTDTRLTPDFVYIRGEAFGAIAEQSINNGNLAEAADYYFQAGKEINQAFDKKKITGRELELREMRARFLGTYVAIREKLCPHQKQHLEVFEAMIEAFRLHHRSDGTIRLGLNRLQSWWTSIEEREHYDEGATRKMRHQLRNLDEIINILDATPIKLASLILECRKTSQLLAERLDGYRFRFTEG
jgi:tetratricopeptide (TPR) repeat protein